MLMVALFFVGGCTHLERVELFPAVQEHEQVEKEPQTVPIVQVKF
jgi:hypothetical protein